MRQNQNNLLSTKKTLSLAIASALAILVFSFMGAPFVRVFASTAKSIMYWALGVVIVAGLYFFNLPVASVYVGAVWMTLGAYSELEKRGINWKKSTAVSIITGMLYAAVLFMILTKGFLFQNSMGLNQDFTSNQFLNDLMTPIQESLKRAFPDQDLSQINLLFYIPGVFASAIMASLAVSLVFETNVFQMFKLRREKIATSLKWLEFRLPDAFIWFAFTSFLFALIGQNGVLKTISINLSVFSIVAFFLQGISVIEFYTRINRWGFFTKIALYLVIFTWLGPLVAFMGIIDYWLNFRKMVRKKLK